MILCSLLLQVPTGMDAILQRTWRSPYSLKLQGPDAQQSKAAGTGRSILSWSCPRILGIAVAGAALTLTTLRWILTTRRWILTTRRWNCAIGEGLLTPPPTATPATPATATTVAAVASLGSSMCGILLTALLVGRRVKVMSDLRNVISLPAFFTAVFCLMSRISAANAISALLPQC